MASRRLILNPHSVKRLSASSPRPFPSFFFLWSLPPTMASCSASYCPLPHQEHNCRLPCLCGVHTAQFGEAFLRHLQFLKLGYQLDLGTRTGRKVDRTPSVETIATTVILQGAKRKQAPLPYAAAPWQQTPNFFSDSRLKEE